MFSVPANNCQNSFATEKTDSTNEESSQEYADFINLFMKNFSDSLQKSENNIFSYNYITHKFFTQVYLLWKSIKFVYTGLGNYSLTAFKNAIYNSVIYQIYQSSACCVL